MGSIWTAVSYDGPLETAGTCLTVTGSEMEHILAQVIPRRMVSGQENVRRRAQRGQADFTRALALDVVRIDGIPGDEGRPERNILHWTTERAGLEPADAGCPVAPNAEGVEHACILDLTGKLKRFESLWATELEVVQEVFVRNVAAVLPFHGREGAVEEDHAYYDVSIVAHKRG